ncbi:DUF1990 domain-containing protein [Gordonia rubripertincta]|uniref:DUF1990 domain-containing protein n=1 Tax=Gordonia rubripertincta TaxID=36822 RepID=A0AAW4G7C0_GORRU|nr:DUF1990 domain-containing protein [Gordonia rubripertincta]MBM7279428.1 DUF1990 domain-containing protein [Gordonia rubripertincta]
MTPHPSGLTYREVGATAGELPAGYHHLRRSRVIGAGEECFFTAADRILNWDMHRRAGIGVDASTPSAAVGSAVTMRLGIGPVRISAACRVIEVIDTVSSDAGAERGFAYGTLSGHPEIGEERFWVELLPDGSVIAHIVAFSRPGRWFTRLGGLIGRIAQARITERYLDALMCS